MAGQGDIDLLVGIADTISSPPGTITTRPLVPASWQVVAPTLTTRSTSAPLPQGGLENDAPKPTDPDYFIGSFTLAVVVPTLGVGSHSAPVGKGDIADVFGAPDLGMDAQAAGLAAFTSGAPTIGLGSVAVPPEHGDIGDTGGPTTLQGDVNDSNQGVSTLTSWSSGTATLGLGSIPQVRSHGDIGEVYGQGEGPIGQVVWQVVAPALATGVTTAPHGSGDVTDPYAWEDAVFYLTSQPYPLQVIEQIAARAAIVGGLFYNALYSYSESIASTVGITGGALTTNLITYSNWPAESIASSSAVTGGTLQLALIVYSNWPAESIAASAAIVGGTLPLSLIVYSNWPAESIASTAGVTGGTLI